MNKLMLLLLVLLALSMALNIRFWVVFSKSHDDFYISMQESMKKEDMALLSLEDGEIEEAKSILSKSVGEKAVFIGICIENKCVRDSAIKKLSTHNKQRNSDSGANAPPPVR
jgi:hypothetical protein